ncbi:hypothetical protein JKP88DRAFT_307809 [Tribonema minus]|uniref:Uncharacterized protein n=1 Tax=Tribonema minus TaxID=303371 RepID=A0A835Z551_9STRA|nr:hypothetical protein JKP88DRAFT_307809 [Tribonema minus]
MTVIIDALVAFAKDVQSRYELEVKADGSRDFVIPAVEMRANVHTQLMARLVEYQEKRIAFETNNPLIAHNYKARSSMGILADTSLANAVTDAKKELKGEPIAVHFNCTDLKNAIRKARDEQDAANRDVGMFNAGVARLAAIYTWASTTIQNGAAARAYMALAIIVVTGFRIGEITHFIKTFSVGEPIRIGKVMLETLSVFNLEKKRLDHDGNDKEGPYQIPIYPVADVTATLLVQRITELRAGWEKPELHTKKAASVNRVIAKMDIFASMRPAYMAHYAPVKARFPSMNITFTARVCRTLYFTAVVLASGTEFENVDGPKILRHKYRRVALDHYRTTTIVEVPEDAEEPDADAAGELEPDAGAAGADELEPDAGAAGAGEVEPDAGAAAAPVAPPTPAAPVAHLTPAAPVAPPTPAAPVAPPTPAAPVAEAAGAAGADDDDDFDAFIVHYRRTARDPRLREIAAAAAAAPIAPAAGAAAVAAPVVDEDAGTDGAAGVDDGPAARDAVNGTRKRKAPTSSDPREKIFQAIMESDISWADKHAIMSVTLAEE